MSSLIRFCKLATPPNLPLEKGGVQLNYTSITTGITIGLLPVLVNKYCPT